MQKQKLSMVVCFSQYQDEMKNFCTGPHIHYLYQVTLEL